MEVTFGKSIFGVLTTFFIHFLRGVKAIPSTAAAVQKKFLKIISYLKDDLFVKLFIIKI
jgi:hypothetical protein